MHECCRMNRVTTHLSSMDGAVVLCMLLGCTVPVYGHDFDRNVCSELPETSKCRAAIPMWYFNSTTETCENFIWGGCSGSDNLFPTKEACIRNCHPETCALPPVVGSCRASIRIWFYDVDRQQCSEFYYGGCDGNENKFGSEHDCEIACAGTNLLCEVGETFYEVGTMAVHDSYREKDWFISDCQDRCEAACLEDHPWGACLAYSTRRRWYRCECYLFDRQVSEHEFDYDTSGTSRNRECSDGRRMRRLV